MRLARYGIMPTLDFDQETSFAVNRIKPNVEPQSPPTIQTFPSKISESSDEPSDKKIRIYLLSQA